MRRIPRLLHHTIITAIEQPPAANLLFLRGYNALLRFFGGPFLARTYFGAEMLCDPKDLVQHIILHFGVWEPNTSAVVEKLLSPGDVCVDVGANVGYDALLAAHLVGNKGAVIAIEASPSIFEILSRNIALNSTSNIRLVHAAVSDRVGRLNVYAAPSGNRGQTTTLPNRSYPLEASVEALPLDQILSRDELDNLRLIKMDICEPPVMRRFLDTLDLYSERVSLLVEVSPSADWTAVFQRMLVVGFSAFAVENSYDRLWYLKRRCHLTPLKQVDAVPNGQIDILFICGEPPTLDPSTPWR